MEKRKPLIIPSQSPAGSPAKNNGVERVWLRRFCEVVGPIETWGDADAIEILAMPDIQWRGDDDAEQVIGPRGQQLTIHDPEVTLERLVQHLAALLSLPVQRISDPEKCAQSVFARLGVMAKNNRYLCLVVDTREVPMESLLEITDLVSLSAVKLLLLNTGDTHFPSDQNIKVRQFHVKRKQINKKEKEAAPNEGNSIPTPNPFPMFPPGADGDGAAASVDASTANNLPLSTSPNNRPRAIYGLSFL